MKIPAGTIVIFDEQAYRIMDDKAYPLLSWSAVESWAQPLVTVEDLDFPVSSAKLGFRPTSVLLCNDQYYYIEGIKKRLISSDFWELGFNKFESIEVSTEELDFHPNGENLD